jgi:hypothetical protein
LKANHNATIIYVTLNDVVIKERKSKV